MVLCMFIHENVMPKPGQSLETTPMRGTDEFKRVFQGPTRDIKIS